MTKQSESAKRDFINQMITLAQEEKTNMIEKGFDPTTKLEEIKAKSEIAIKKEIEQQEASAKAKEATISAQTTLADAYKEASNLADLISGLYGKDNAIVKKIRKFRN